MFENVAENYDRMNDTMSVGVHRLWKDLFMHRLSPTPATQLLDVAGGTGKTALTHSQSQLPKQPDNIGINLQAKAFLRKDLKGKC